MSLNCLTCQSQQRTDSDLDLRSLEDKCRNRNLCFLKADRPNWSGPLVSPPYEQIRDVGSTGPSEASARKRKGQRRVSIGSMSNLGIGPGGGPDQPKLIRSGGMRRDWSFEDLRRARREGNRKERRQA